MAKQPRAFAAQVTADNATADGVEEVVATLAGVAPRTADERIRLVGTVFATGAVGTTAATLRIRRDSLAGAVVGEAAVTALAGAVTGNATVQAEDTGRGEGSFTYVLTASIAGAAATVNSAVLTALVG